MKTVDLELRPVFHWTAPRVRAHVLLCLLPYYPEWHMRQTLAQMLFDDHDRAAAEVERTLPVAKAKVSKAARRKASTQHVDVGDGESRPEHSFRTLLGMILFGLGMKQFFMLRRMPVLNFGALRVWREVVAARRCVADVRHRSPVRIRFHEQIGWHATRHRPGGMPRQRRGARRPHLGHTGRCRWNHHSRRPASGRPRWHGSPMSTLIAIVDDDEPVRVSLLGLIRSLGYTACSFASAQAFLVSAERDKVACIVTDLQMPGMSGLDLQKALKALGCGPPVIIITAFPDERLKHEALADGAFSFLSKPFQSQDLARVLSSACSSRRPS
jgi:CheY-like chemotaxis protein